jgi:CoA-dependent NAD(P)H sulfur oxidoreductase
MKFLIIGGDAAGMSAASRAKRNDSSIDVTVLEKTEDVSYSACGMPYNIADPERIIDDLVVRKADVFREKQGIHLLTGHCAKAIDPSKKTVAGVRTDGTEFGFSYDNLLIATGASPVIPDRPGFDLPGVVALKSLADGRKIRKYLEENTVKKAVIIGMGYIGLEMCEALCARSIAVDMVKPGPVFLPWMQEELSSVIKDEVAANNVRLYPGHTILGIESKGDGLNVLCDEITLEADMVLVAIGVKPNSSTAKDAGLDLSLHEAIAVDKQLGTSVSSIYSAGDCADAFHVVTGARTWIPLALRANRAGWAVGDNISGKEVELPGISGTAVFKVFDLEVARTGLSAEEAAASGFDPEEVVISTRSRAHAHPGSITIKIQMTGDKKTGRLLGCRMVGKEGVAHRINAASVALHASLTVKDFFQTDLAYAPPFGPVWDPLLTAANQLIKKIEPK